MTEELPETTEPALRGRIPSDRFREHVRERGGVLTLKCGWAPTG
jgi:hypothetical protein